MAQDKASTHKRPFALRLNLTRTALRLLIELQLITQLKSHGAASIGFFFFLWFFFFQNPSHWNSDNARCVGVVFVLCCVVRGKLLNPTLFCHLGGAGVCHNATEIINVKIVNVNEALCLRGFRRVLSGISYGSVRVMSSFCQGSAKILLWFCLGSVRVLSGICQGSVMVLSGLCQGMVRDRPRFCYGAVGYLPQFCRGYASVLSGFGHGLHPYRSHVGDQQWPVAHRVLRGSVEWRRKWDLTC